MAPSFLITGATGQQGGATARLLLKNNVIVHALVRNPNSEAAQSLEKDGAILFKGDFDDVAAINTAIAGVTGVFLNPYPNRDPDVQIRQARNFVTAAIAVKSVTTFVVSTACWTGDRETWGNNDSLRAYYIQKAAIEDAVRTAGFQNHTILRPAWIMQNYLLPQVQYYFPELAKEGLLVHGYEPQTRMAHLDARDVGLFAAAALLDPAKFNGHEIALGFENLTAIEVARHLSEASGVNIEARKLTDSEIELLYNKSPSLPFQLNANLHDLFVDGEKLQKDYGIRLTSFAEFLQKEREALSISPPSQK